ncbi:MAG TPA: nucleoside hydrolase [Candidatus Saccharimonadales bacterium]|nr:nucleoside hydrolase [Candidatus Saccharimonadales bacterium]
MKFLTLKSKMAHEPIICDTDAGSDVDDFLALAYLIKTAPDHLKLISTTYGPVETRAKAVATLLASMYVDIPIVTGRQDRVTPGPHTTWLTGGEDYLIDPDAHFEDADLLDSYLQFDHFTLLAIGPLTNVASLLQHPEFVQRCSRIVIMGGSINPGGPVPAIEHNFKLDPIATKIVMDSSVPKVLVPVDLTVAIPMTEIYQALFHESKQPYAQLLSGWIKNWRKITNAFEPPFYDSVHWHDPIAAAFLFHPELFETEVMRFETTEDGALVMVENGGHAALVCTKMQPKVVDIMTRAILGRTVRRYGLSARAGLFQYFKKKTTTEQAEPVVE